MQEFSAGDSRLLVRAVTVWGWLEARVGGKAQQGPAERGWVSVREK